MVALFAEQPDTIVVSGGAVGVDKTAETCWSDFGARVESYRVRELSPIEFAIERWRFGSWPYPTVTLLIEDPTFADRKSALNYRNILIAEACHRLVLFHRRGWRGGGGMTEQFARETYGRPTYIYEAGVAA